MNFQALETAAGHYRAQLGDEMIDLLLDIWANQMNLTPEVTWRTGAPHGRQTCANGSPLLATDTPQVDREWFIEALTTLLATIERHQPVSDDDRPTVFAADVARIEADDLRDAVLDPKEAAERILARLGLDSATDRTLMTLAVSSALQPFAAAAAQELAAAIPADDSGASGTCPVCGAEAALGVITEDSAAFGGKRFLWCPVCDTEWRYPRVKCVRCGNVTQAELHYYYDESDPGHRIHVCDACGGSISVAHAGLLRRAVVPRVEEIAMLALHSAVLSRVMADEDGAAMAATTGQGDITTKACCSSTEG